MKNIISLFFLLAMAASVHAQQNNNSNVPVKQDDGSASRMQSAAIQTDAAVPLKKSDGRNARVTDPQNTQTLAPVKKTENNKSNAVTTSTIASLPPIKKTDGAAPVPAGQATIQPTGANKNTETIRIVLPSSTPVKKDSTIAH